MRRRAALGALLLAACPAKDPVGFVEPPADGARVTDPVTRKTCDKTPTTPSAVFEERSYYFCAPESAARFRQDMARYADAPS